MAGPNPNRQFDALKDIAAKARRPFDKDVLLNTAFYLDQQYVEYVGQWNSIRMIPRRAKEENIPRPVSNKIMHFVQQEHSYALQNKPNADVQPATTDPGDLSLASVAQAWLDYLSEPQIGDFDGELSDAVLWALIGGEAFLKWTYSSEEGRPDFCSVSPLDLYTDPYATKFKHARYAIHSQFMDVETIYDLYDKEVKPETLTQADQSKAALMRELGQAPVVNGAVVNELWYRPCRRYPEGIFCAWTGSEQLVEPDKFPYRHKRLPFTQIGSIPRPGTSHYTCAVKYLRSPQMERNKYHAQRLMVREAFSNPKWWIDAMLELEADPDDSPRQILRGNSQGGQIKPEIIQPEIFPEQTDGDWLKEEMNDVVGLHEISQGQVPGRVEAARAIETLKEADTSRLAELERTIKSSVSEGFWQVLMLTQQYGNAKEVVQTYSAEGMPETKELLTRKIKPGMRVRVTMGTGLARSRVAREQQVAQWWQDGVIQDPEILANMLDIPLSRFVPQRDFDIRLARNENLLMAKGTPIKPNSWDEHMIHLREHNNFRKTGEFEALPTKTKTKWEFHCQTHEQLMMEKLVKDAQMQAVMQGAVPQPAQGGGGSQPAADQTAQPTPPEQVASQGEAAAGVPDATTPA